MNSTRQSLKSKKVKSLYDQWARDVNFFPREKVWFFNPRREKDKAPKLQSYLGGIYKVVKKLSDVV